MPKMKTNKGAAKRFKKLGNGKIKARSAGTSHILTSKTTKRKRNLRKSKVLTGGDAKRAQVLLPN